MTPTEINDLLKERFPQYIAERPAYPEIKEAPALQRPRPLVRSAVILREELTVKSEGIREVLEFLHNDERLEFDMLHAISGIDYAKGEPLGVTWTLTSIRHKHWCAINTRIARDNPTIPSVHDIWPAADWHERETFDLVGIIFVGHPNLKRILCADDWEGHPLRKDYVFPAEYHGIPTAKEVRWNS